VQFGKARADAGNIQSSGERMGCGEATWKEWNGGYYHTTPVTNTTLPSLLFTSLYNMENDNLLI